MLVKSITRPICGNPLSVIFLISCVGVNLHGEEPNTRIAKENVHCDYSSIFQDLFTNW